MIVNYQSLLVAKVTEKKDTSRPHLKGVLLEPDGRTVATDGHRIAVVTAQKNHGMTDDERFPEAVDNPESIIIPNALANELTKTLKSQKVGEKKSPTYRSAALVGVAEESVEFQTKAKSGLSLRMGAKPVDAKYPSYEKVIPEVSPETHAMISVDAHYLLQLARMALDFGSKHIELAVSTSHPEDRYAKEGFTLECMVATCESNETWQKLTHVLMPVRT